MIDSRSNAPFLKGFVVVIAILVAFVHNTSAEDGSDNNVDAKKQTRIRRKNRVTTTTGLTTPKTYLVSFSDKEVAPAKQCAALAKTLGATVHHVYEHALSGCSLILPSTQAQTAYTAMNDNPIVHDVELDQEIYLAHEAILENIIVHTDTRMTVQASAVAPSWGLDRINQCTLPLDNIVTKQNAAGVNVFIIDTGIYANHREFANGVIGPEDCHFSLFSNENALTDAIGHGTHVAGTVCGAQYGVSSNCTLCSVKVFDATGRGTVEGAIAGIDHVVSKCSSGTDGVIRWCVVNMSLESKKSDIFNRAIANAVSKGVVMVVAAGNNNTDACSVSPASTASAITVGSITRADIKSSFSNWGSCVDVYAPGSFITSAWISSPADTADKSGTSMASPHVAGIAAAIRSSNPTWTTSQVRDAIVNSGAPLPSDLILATVDDINCSRLPTEPPSRIPSYSPTTTTQPSLNPTFNPSSTVGPTSTLTPSSQPTVSPSSTDHPTSGPTYSAQPSFSPTFTDQPTSDSTHSAKPTSNPTRTDQPSSVGTNSAKPSLSPTITDQPTSDSTHSAQPSSNPTRTDQPSSVGTNSAKPSLSPTITDQPTTCTAATIVEVKVMTDQFPHETAWTLVHKCSTPGTVINSPPYTAPFTNYSTTLCLTRCSSYKFTITDSFGDGLCCTWGNGGYEVIVNGRSVHSGGVFLVAETTLFDLPTNQPSLRPSQSPTNTNRPSFNPTIYPTISSEPTHIPTRSPTFSPTPCTAGMDIEVKVLTDEFPLETTWTLSHKCGTGIIINSPQYTAPLTIHTTKICLPSCSAYKFTISDSYGDGLCCGSGEGGYELLVNGRTVHSGGAFFGSETIFLYPPTNQPSPRPSGDVTGLPTQQQPTSQPTSSPTSPLSTFKPTSSPTSNQPTFKPAVTDQPTFRPTSIKPTDKPIIPTPTITSCTAGTNIEVKVLTDKYPLETAWTLSQKCDTSVGTTISSPKYTAPLTMHSTKLCLPSCSSYKFTITDSLGDGLCCKWGIGRYEILVNGHVVRSGGDFYESETKLFGPAHGDKKILTGKQKKVLPLFD